MRLKGENSHSSVSLDEYFADHTGDRVDDLDMRVGQPPEGGLVDIVGERDGRPVLVSLGGDDPVRDTGKTFITLRNSQDDHLVQYINEDPASMVADSLGGYADKGRLECYVHSVERGIHRFTPYGQQTGLPAKSQEDTGNMFLDYIINNYVESDEEAKMYKRIASMIE